MSSGVSDRPAGSPSIKAISAGPWDSPAVRYVRATRPSLQAGEPTIRSSCASRMTTGRRSTPSNTQLRCDPRYTWDLISTTLMTRFVLVEGFDRVTALPTARSRVALPPGRLPLVGLSVTIVDVID